MTKRIKAFAAVVLASFMLGGIFAPAASAATPVVARKTAVVVVDRKAGAVDLTVDRKTGVERKAGTTEKER